MLQSIFVYNLEVIICCGLLLTYYWIALRDKQFHQYNRFYLMATVVLSAILPLLRLQWFTFNASSPQTIHLFNIITSNTGEQVDAGLNNSFQWQSVVLCLFFLTAVLLLASVAYKIKKIFSLKNKFPVTNMDRFDFVLTDLPQAPFSFFNNLFWRKDIDLHEETGKQILEHEITHIRQKHSVDKLFIQVVLCFYWINPCFWLLRKELYVIHEFIADEKAVANSAGDSLAKMLLTFQFKKFDLLPAQSFFYSPIKRRLLMLTKSKKPGFSYLRRIMTLPLILALVCLFAFTVKQNSAALPQQIISDKHFVLVVDAGHGGKDIGAVGNGLKEKDITLKIAQEIKSLSTDYGIEVILTRSDDAFMSPAEKSSFANAQKADAFISIHVNADPQRDDQSGFEVLLTRKNAQAFSSVLFGSAILQSIQADFQVVPSLLQKDRGVWVLDNSILPSALLECGYLTNKGDANLLQDNSKIEFIAKAILNGAALYANNKNSISPKNIVPFDRDTSDPAKTTSQAQKPLYILDGKIISKEKVDQLDPASIQQMNVLKEKDATDKYGDKGKNGVVEIVSKNKMNETTIPPPPPPDSLRN